MRAALVAFSLTAPPLEDFVVLGDHGFGSAPASAAAEAVYLQDLEDGFEAQRVIDGWMACDRRAPSAVVAREEAYRDRVTEREEEVA